MVYTRSQKSKDFMYGKFMIIVVLTSAVLLTCVGTEPSAIAEDVNESDGVTVYQPDDGTGIIPKPGSGKSPSSITDRGGALQLTLLGLLILFPVVAIISVRRQGKRRLSKP